MTCTLGMEHSLAVMLAFKQCLVRQPFFQCNLTFFVRQTNITRFYDEGKIYWFMGLHKMEEIYMEKQFILFDKNILLRKCRVSRLKAI